MTDVSTLTVRLYNEPIGTLTYVGGERTLFVFNDIYINDSNRPTLSLSFKDTFGQLLTDFKPYRSKLMPFFPTCCLKGICANIWLTRQACTQKGNTFY